MAKKIIVESRAPKVGIWWLLDTQMIEFSVDARDAEEVLGFRDSPFDHWAKWDDVVKMYPQLQDKEYTDIPRGRVLWAGSRKRYEIITSSTVARDEGAVNKIMRAFSLPIANTIVVADPHYEADFVDEF